MKKYFKLKPNNHEKCPKCGNNQEFHINVQQCAIDHCEVFVTCKCGFDPTASDGNRIEDVWGSIEYGNIVASMECWDESIQDMEANSQE